MPSSCDTAREGSPLFPSIISMIASAWVRSIRPVHKGTLRKFAGFSHARIVIYEQFQDLSNRHNTAVTLNFHHIFCRVRMRALSLITQEPRRWSCSLLDPQWSVLNRSILAVHQRNGASALEQAIYNRKTILAANTNNTNPADAGRRRNGRYCIIYIHKNLRISIIYYAFHKTYEIKIHRFDLLLTIYVLDISNIHLRL